YLPEDQVQRVLRCYQREIAGAVFAQMQQHFNEGPTEFEYSVASGFDELRPRAFTQSGDPLDFRQVPPDKANIARYVFIGFQRCLYETEKFDSDPERRLAVIPERASEKWLRPAPGQLQIPHKSGVKRLE